MIRKFFKWLVEPPKKTESSFDIIRWWEIRRIPYNLIVGPLGIISLIMFFVFVELSRKLEPGEDAVEPFAIILAPIAINILYTCGWMAELFLRIVWKEKSTYIGPILFKLGISLSVCAILFPSTMWFVIWIFS